MQIGKILSKSWPPEIQHTNDQPDINSTPNTSLLCKRCQVAQLEDRATSQDDHQDVAKLKGNGC